MKKLLLIFLTLVATFAKSNAQPNFVRVTNTILTAESVFGGGAAWADYDGDGWSDLAQANFAGVNRLFHNNGDGSFTKITTNGMAIEGPESYGVSWGDFDNDRQPDLFIGDGYNSSASSLLFHNRTAANGTFARLTTGPGTTGLSARSSGCAWADYDRDGFPDLFVANSDSKSCYLWHNKGDGTFERVLTGAIVNNIADSVGAAWADYDNDGWPDLFVANGLRNTHPAQKNFLYHNNRDGTFTQVTNGPVANDVTKSCGVAWGDCDNDGFPDLFVTSVEGHNYLYHNNGDGTFSSLTQGAIVNDTGNFISAGWADYDNDGWLDLFVGNRLGGGKNVLYHNNGDGTFTKIATGTIAEDSAPNGGCAWGDYDNDGFTDLFVSVLGGNSLLYRNTGTTNHWLRLKLEGTVSNRAALGAKIRVTANVGGMTLTQMREITSGDGFNGNSPVAQFGLGGATIAATVRLEWPSGIVRILTNVAADKSLTIVEHQESAAGPISLAAKRLTNGTVRLSATGNPGLWYLFEASSDLADWTWLGARSNLTGTVEFVDSASTNLNHRFYRASVP